MFVDTHCHLDFSCFSAGLDALMQSLAEKQITHLVISAIDRQYWPRIKSLSDRYLQVSYALGVHPHFLGSFKSDDIHALENELKNRSKRCVAVGEVGLDKLAKADSTLQESVFIAQLKLAQQYQLPVILHIVKKQQGCWKLLMN